MILSDTEWLRFVSFGMFAGGTLGAIYTGALLALGRTLPTALAGSVVATGIVTLLLHLFVRKMIDAEIETAAAPTDDQTEDTSA